MCYFNNYSKLGNRCLSPGLVRRHLIIYRKLISLDLEDYQEIETATVFYTRKPNFKITHKAKKSYVKHRRGNFHYPSFMVLFEVSMLNIKRNEQNLFFSFVLLYMWMHDACDKDPRSGMTSLSFIQYPGIKFRSLGLVPFSDLCLKLILHY